MTHNRMHTPTMHKQLASDLPDISEDSHNKLCNTQLTDLYKL